MNKLEDAVLEAVSIKNSTGLFLSVNFCQVSVVFREQYPFGQLEDHVERTVYNSEERPI